MHDSHKHNVPARTLPCALPGSLPAVGRPPRGPPAQCSPIGGRNCSYSGSLCVVIHQGRIGIHFDGSINPGARAFFHRWKLVGHPYSSIPFYSKDRIYMPKNTRVHRCVDRLRLSRPYGQAIAICQKATKQNYMTGHTIKTKRPVRSKKRRSTRKRKRRR